MPQTRKYKYQTDAGTIVNIRLTPAKAAATGNAQPSGAVDDPKVWAVVSDAGRRRKSSLAPRGVRYARTVTFGTDENHIYYLFVPACTPAALTAMFGAENLNYEGNVWTPLSVVPEA